VTDDLFARHDAASGGHDAGIRLHESGEPFEGADAPAQPRAVAIVEQRPVLCRYDSSDRDQVQLWEIDEEITVGVRGGQIAVLDLLAREFD